jgi:hypothetical protein
MVPRGSFSLNKSLGSNLKRWKGGLTSFKFEFERTLRNILLNYDDVYSIPVEYVKEDGKIEVKLKVFVAGEARTLNLEFEEGD